MTDLWLCQVIYVNLFNFVAVHSFDKFLAAHVNLAFTKGFNDNVGRHLQTPSFAVSGQMK